MPWRPSGVLQLKYLTKYIETLQSGDLADKPDLPDLP